MILRIEKHGQVYKAFDTVTGVECTEPRQIMMQLAYEGNEVLYLAGAKWRRRSASADEKVVKSKSKLERVGEAIATVAQGAPTTVLEMIHRSPEIRPSNIFISDLKWKTLCRGIIRGKNILVTGNSGAGKTETVIASARALNRPFFRFNLGASQDPKSFLLGNTHFEKDSGTVFRDSAFIKAIETENAVILMDELTRAHPDAHNILMTVLDKQRYLRIDDDPNSPVISVAEGVSFIATANIGNEFTATRKLDKAMKDRFSIEIEMDILNKVEEASLLSQIYPTLTPKQLDIITNITTDTRSECKSDSSKLSHPISTRNAIEIAGFIDDGFTVAEASEVCIYPLYSTDGGAESERVYIKQIIQKYIDDKSEAKLNKKVEVAEEETPF